MLPNISDRSFLIISDAYPPYVVGGAEISLYATIKQLPRTLRKKIVIITFGADVETVQHQIVEEVIVLRAPEAAQFPYQELSHAQAKVSKLKRIFGVRYATRIKFLYHFMFPKRARDILLHRKEVRLSPKGNALTDFLSYSANYETGILSQVVKAMAGKVVLLTDNTRSIIRGGILLKNTKARNKIIKITSVVRDNRFHCPRPKQNSMVGNKECRHPCVFECAKEDVKQGLDIRKTALLRTSEFRRSILNSYDTILTTSHQLCRQLAKYFPEEKIIRVPNGYGSASEYDRYSRGIAERPEDSIVIIGMLNENKGQLDFLEKTLNWIRENKSIEIKICGRGDRIEKHIVDFCKKHKIEKQVKLLGFKSRENLAKIISESKIVVAPTVWPEPFGRVPLEAGILRKPIVAFAVGGLSESIVNGHTGYLVKPRDYQAMTERIDYLFDNPSKRVEMCHNARKHIEREFGQQKTTDLFADTVFNVDEGSF